MQVLVGMGYLVGVGMDQVHRPLSNVDVSVVAFRKMVVYDRAPRRKPQGQDGQEK